MNEFMPFLWLLLGAALLLGTLPFGPVHRWLRKTLLPIVVRENWTSREYRDDLRKTRERDKALSGSLNWQAHSELQRMSDAASTLSTSLIDWRTQVAGLEAEASRLEEKEHEATLAEAKVEALDLAATPPLVGELDKLELEKDLDALRARSAKPAWQSETR